MSTTSKADDWMPIYWGHYLRDTAHLCAAEHGAYLLLIGHYWTTGPLPNDADRLRRIARMDEKEWRRHSTTVLSFFRAEGELLRHGRIDREMEKARKRVAAKSQAGQAGAAARWQTNGKRNGTGMADASVRHRQSDAPSPPQLHSAIAESGGGGDARPPDSAEDKRVAEHFLAERDRLWPNEARLPAPLMTLRAEAHGWLTQGAPADLLTDTLTRQMGAAQAKGHGPPTSLKAYNRSLQTDFVNWKSAHEQQRNDAPIVVRPTPRREQQPDGWTELARELAAERGVGGDG